LGPSRIVGLDASERYIAEARSHADAGLDFEVHDVTRAPFPVPAPELMLCRFLLTHLRQPETVLATWASVAAPGACLLVHETERLESPDPNLRRYYELVSDLQQHYGQALNVGERLEGAVAGAGWTVVDSRAPRLEKPAAAMAELHLANIETWRQDAFARRAFDGAELDRLQHSLERIVSGADDGGVVYNTARQIVAIRA
jgi:SAM-dependent methyltransferase